MKEMVESIQELRARCQSVHSDDFSAQIVRSVSIYFTRALIPFGVGANAVSIANVLVGIASGIFFALGTTWALLVGLGLFTLNSILDGVDGELARYWRKSSLTGLFMDRMNSIFLYPAVFGGLAIGLWEREGGIVLLIVAVMAVWASTAVRLAKTTIDTTVVDALTLSKARQEAPAQQAATGSYIPMSEHLRATKRWYLYAVDFITVRQPGFNIALAAAVVVHLAALRGEWWPSSWSPLLIYIAGYALAFSLAVIYALTLATRAGRIEGTVAMLKEKLARHP